MRLHTKTVIQTVATDLHRCAQIINIEVGLLINFDKEIKIKRKIFNQ